MGYFIGHSGYMGIDRVYERVRRVRRRVQPLYELVEQVRQRLNQCLVG